MSNVRNCFLTLLHYKPSLIFVTSLHTDPVIMAALSKNESNDQWSCPMCTFKQSALNTECQLCGNKNLSISSSPSHVNRQNAQNTEETACGSIIYQNEPFTAKQLERDYALYLQNDKWSVYLFGDNDIDRDRPPNSEREMVGGPWSIVGRYDNSIGYGITTTFYTFKPMISLMAFRKLMDEQFDSLWRRFMVKGHSVLISTPSPLDLVQHRKSFHEDSDQVIFHKLCCESTTTALPMTYSKYIQFKMDQISTLSVEWVYILFLSLFFGEISILVAML